MVSKEEILEALEEEERADQEEATQDAQDEAAQTQRDFEQAYGAPEPEQGFNKHIFLADSLRNKSPEKVTYLTASELGRPLFNVRFLLDIEDICNYYLNEMFAKYKVKNKISEYFRAKINNISDSGMSNEGFIQNLNVTSKMDMSRKRTNSNNINNLKGGNKSIG